MTDAVQIEKNARTWAMLCHLSGLALFVGIPFGNIIGPLVVWLVKKDEFPFVDEQGKESLNFQISITIYAFVAALLVFIVIGIPLLMLLILADVILIVVAAVKTNSGQHYRYPLTIQFFKHEPYLGINNS